MGVDFLKKMDWLGADRLRAYVWLFAVPNLAGLLWLVTTSRHGVDANGNLLGSDFISFWTVGRMLHTGGSVYDNAAHVAAQRTYFASESSYTAFFYPPTFLPFCWPLGLMGYFPALGIWLLGTGTFYLSVVRTWLRSVGPEVRLWPLALAFPAVAIVVTHGQTSFLVAGLLGSAAFLVRARPILAGVLFGLATIKPQFGLLVPLVLLLTGERKVIASATATAVALMAISALAFGPDVIVAWLSAGKGAQDALATGSVGFGKMMSPYAALRLIGVPVTFAYVAQVAVSLTVAAALARVVSRRQYTLAMGGAMLSGALLVTPFVLDYDFVLLAFPMILIAGEGVRTGFRDWEKLVLLLAFAMPLFARPLALTLGVPVMPLVSASLFAMALRRASADAQPARVVRKSGEEPCHG